jgi:hypothetical protein
MSKRLRGVFAAVATASTADREVDCARSIALAHYLLSNGCDGLIKTVLAHIHKDAEWKRLMPPFAPFPDADSMEVVTGDDGVRVT